MEPGIFTEIQKWIAENIPKLNRVGMTLSVKEPQKVNGVQSFVIELENRDYLGTVTLNSVRRVDIGCARKSDMATQFARSEVYTEKKLAEFIGKLLTWMDPEEFPEDGGCEQRVAYPTRSEARRAKKQSKVDLHLNRVDEEQCAHCGMWHLSGNYGSKTPARKPLSHKR